MPRRSRWLLLAVIPLTAVAGHVGKVSVVKTEQRYVIEGEAIIEAPVSAVYRLITDYDALARLDKGIAESRLVERVDDTTALVYTSLKGCVVVFCRKVERVERVEEVSDSEIVAVVVPSGDSNVSYGKSHWQLFPQQGGTRIEFNSEVEPDFWIPSFIGPALIKRALKKRVVHTLHNLELAATAYEQ